MRLKAGGIAYYLKVVLRHPLFVVCTHFKFWIKFLYSLFMLLVLN